MKINKFFLLQILVIFFILGIISCDAPSTMQEESKSKPEPPSENVVKLSTFFQKIQVQEETIHMTAEVVVYAITSDYQEEIALEVISGVVESDSRIKITELATIESLQVKNITKRPVMMLKGTLFKGKSQNRVLVRDVVIKVNQTVNIETKCVQQTQDLIRGRTLTPSRFLAPASIRLEVVSAQLDVWAKIKEMNDKAGINSVDLLDAYSKIVMGQRLREAKEKEYHNHFIFIKNKLITKLSKYENNAVGFLIVLPRADSSPSYFVEIFHNTKIFNEYREQIVDSIVIEALLSSAGFRLENFGSKFEKFKELFKGCIVKPAKEGGDLWEGSNSKSNNSLTIEAIITGTLEKPIFIHLVSEGLFRE